MIDITATGNFLQVSQCSKTLFDSCQYEQCGAKVLSHDEIRKKLLFVACVLLQMNSVNLTNREIVISFMFANFTKYLVNLLYALGSTKYFVSFANLNVKACFLFVKFGKFARGRYYIDNKFGKHKNSKTVTLNHLAYKLTKKKILLCKISQCCYLRNRNLTDRLSLKY